MVPAFLLVFLSVAFHVLASQRNLISSRGEQNKKSLPHLYDQGGVKETAQLLGQLVSQPGKYNRIGSKGLTLSRVFQDITVHPLIYKCPLTQIRSENDTNREQNMAQVTHKNYMKPLSFGKVKERQANVICTQNSHEIGQESGQKQNGTLNRCALPCLSPSRNRLIASKNYHHQKDPVNGSDHCLLLDELIPADKNNKPSGPNLDSQNTRPAPLIELELDRWTSRVLNNAQADEKAGKSWAQELAELQYSTSSDELHGAMPKGQQNPQNRPSSPQINTVFTLDQIPNQINIPTGTTQTLQTMACIEINPPTNAQNDLEIFSTTNKNTLHLSLQQDRPLSANKRP
uniref:Uncharacterized protein n=1 Tax=Sphaerodactylus townsendi TaxID=933632 RepID=A0ACB8EGH3_9SAUR